MIALFTDFGLHDPYVGQLHAALASAAPGVPVIDLFHAVPNFDIRAAAYLLPAYTAMLPPESIVVCVVDPGVGGERRPVFLRAGARWYVGPDNGLFTILARRAADAECWEIVWRPEQLSASFHGRDLFAPVAAQLAMGVMPESRPLALSAPAGEWPDDLRRVVYIDHFGNAITGIRSGQLDSKSKLRVGDTELTYARTFSNAPDGQGFWYENSNGLIEIAVNSGNAAQQLGITIGDDVT